MIYKATKLIKEELDRRDVSRDIKYAAEEFGEVSALLVEFDIDNGPTVTMQFISTDDENDVAVYLPGIVKNIEESKVDEMMKVVNECNCAYSHIKFCMNKDHVDIEYNLPIEIGDHTVGAAACEIFERIVSAADEVYPRFMRVIRS